MSKKIPEITELTKRFNEAVEILINTGREPSYKSISDALGWGREIISKFLKANFI